MKKYLMIFLAIAMLTLAVSCNRESGEVTRGTESAATLAPAATTVTDVVTTKEQTVTEEIEMTPVTTVSGGDAEKPSDKTYKVLFIGNSYTQYNELNGIFRNIAVKAGYKLTSQRVTKGGEYLINHARSDSDTGAQIDALLETNKYDFVIIQEQSTCPVLNPGKFYDGVRAMVEKVRANGAEPILYCTWGRKTGSADLTANNLTNESMTWKLAAAYTAIAEELDIDVAYVGLAFYDVYTNNKSKVNLYDNDLTHPSYAGSYLAAMTIFAKVFGGDPTAVAYKGTLSDDVSLILRAAAKKAVFDTPAIPDEYKTSSEGVIIEKVDFGVDYSQMKNLTSFPTSPLISVLKGGSYDGGRAFSGILGDKGAIASREYSTTGLSDAQKADIADIGYGVSVIGIEKMSSSSQGYTTAVENLVNGHWGVSFMACFTFDDNKYTIDGTVSDDAKYTGLITLNFGEVHRFDAMGFSSGSLQGFPGVAEVFVSDDGVSWERVPTACWDNVNGKKLVSAGKTPADPWNGNTGSVTALFDMEGREGKYIRIGVVVGRNDSENMYNTINTREVLVYGEKIEK